MTTFEVALVDAGSGLKRIEALLQELNDVVDACSARAAVIRGALFEAVSEEVQSLLEEIEAKVEVPELDRRRR